MSVTGFGGGAQSARGEIVAYCHTCSHKEVVGKINSQGFTVIHYADIPDPLNSYRAQQHKDAGHNVEAK